VACFSACEIDRSTSHDYHAIHHNFTTKTPRKNAHFAGTPLKKAPINHEKTPFPAAWNFL
jgi:hypothetical protein